MSSQGELAGHNYRGVPAAERRARRRDQLIDSAIAVYGQSGFHNSTVKAVCDAAGLTERYFYESFPNAQALLVAAFRQVTTKLHGCIRDAAELAARPGQDRVRAILSMWFDALGDDPASTRLFLVEAAGIGGEVSQVLDEEMASLVDLLEEAWGGVPTPSGSMLKTGVAGGLVHMSIAWVEADYRSNREELIEAALQLSSIVRP